MEATKQTKMTKEDLHLSWKDKLNIIRDNRYFLQQHCVRQHVPHGSRRLAG